MENEFNILNNLEKNRNITQRDIAKSTGMSLGNVNILIKRMVKKGLLKIEKLNPKTIRYILTPEGIREKAELTYKYMVISYKYINDINMKIDIILQNNILSDDKNVILFGENDEICQLIQNRFNQNKVAFKFFKTIDMLNELFEEPNSYKYVENTILVWHPSSSEILKENKIKCISLLDNI